MNDSDFWTPVARVLGVILGWIGTITLADFHLLVSIIGSVLVSGYAATQWYVLWRDKIKKR